AATRRPRRGAWGRRRRGGERGAAPPGSPGGAAPRGWPRGWRGEACRRPPRLRRDPWSRDPPRRPGARAPGSPTGVRRRRFPGQATRLAWPLPPSRRGARARRCWAAGSPGLDLPQHFLEGLHEPAMLLRLADSPSQRGLHAEARHGPHDDPFLEEALEDVAAAPPHVDEDEVRARGHVLHPHGRELLDEEVAPRLVHAQALEDVRVVLEGGEGGGLGERIHVEGGAEAIAERGAVGVRDG